MPITLPKIVSNNIDLRHISHFWLFALLLSCCCPNGVLFPVRVFPASDVISFSASFSFADFCAASWSLLQPAKTTNALPLATAVLAIRRFSYQLFRIQHAQHRPLTRPPSITHRSARFAGRQRQTRRLCHRDSP